MLLAVVALALSLEHDIARADAVAVWGEPAPVSGDPAFQNNANADVLPVVNDAGGIAFQADFAGGEGVFAACNGPLSAVVLAGDPSPDGGTFTEFNTTVVGIDDACDVAVRGRGSLRRHVVAVSEAGVMRLVARNLDPAPGSCGSFSDGESTLGAPSLNSQGQIAFMAATTICSRTVVVDTAGAQAIVAQVGQIIAGTSPQRELTSMHGAFNGPRVPFNDGGAVVFSGETREVGVGGATRPGIMLAMGGVLYEIVHPGTPAPLPLSGTFLTVVTTNLAAGETAFDLSNTGDVAFLGTVSDSVTTTRGVFLYSGGQIQPIALEGQAAPGGGAFGTSFGLPKMNGRGDVLFTADVPEVAVFLRAGATLTRVVTEGDGVPGEPGAFFVTFGNLALDDPCDGP